MIKKCSHIDTCCAPFCPLVKDLSNVIWYADEEICKLRKYANLQYIKTQRKISKKDKKAKTYYTFEMINRNFIVKTGITGLDPEKVKLGKEEANVKKWIEGHRERDLHKNSLNQDLYLEKARAIKKDKKIKKKKKKRKICKL